MKRASPLTDQKNRVKAYDNREKRLLSHLTEVWPQRAPSRDVCGLPVSIAALLLENRRSNIFSKAAEQLDRVLPGWTEIAAKIVAAAANEGINTDLQRACALLGHRPLAHPEKLLHALDLSPPGSDACLWLLAALSGTDNAEVRAAWLRHLREYIGYEQLIEPRAPWFAFVHAFKRGWLDWPIFRESLRANLVSAVAGPGSYRPALERLGLWSHPTFDKWYRQAVYETAHQPDVALSFKASSWMRDFPGENYLWDALSELERKPDSWWPLYTVRWVSDLDQHSGRFASALTAYSPVALCLLSVIRPELSNAISRALGISEHKKAIDWLIANGPGTSLDLTWIENTLKPWVEALGEPLVIALGALCSLEPPPDYSANENEFLRRRDFLRECLLPDFDRVMENLYIVHALRKQHFPLLCKQATKGHAAAVQALALWPEKGEEAAAVLFRVHRKGVGSARKAAKEALEILKRRSAIPDLKQLESRLDLATAWADAGLEGRTARIWWDLHGYRVKLSAASGAATLQVYSGERPLISIPKAVKEDPQYAEIKQARSELAKSYRYFCRRFEQAMVEGVCYSRSDFATLMANPVVRSLISRLILDIDGSPFHWTPVDPLDERSLSVEIETANRIGIYHPLDLHLKGALQDWQQRVIDCRTSQPFKQVFREVYLLNQDELTSTSCSRFAGHNLVARKAFALLRSRGYVARQGDAVKEWSQSGIRVHIRWAGPDQQAGRRLSQKGPTEPVTSGPVWFTTQQAGAVVLGEVPPIIVSETLRDADLLVSRAAAGELGFTSEETRRLRATLIRYLSRAMSLTNIYVSDDSPHVLVEGRRAMYRVHLGSGSVLVETTRRHMDVTGITHDPMETLIGESMDSLTARVIGIIITLSQDEKIGDEFFLRQIEKS